ncbi:metal ABC transporter ATP-binding protein [bacterium]|nr:metal ABC transporter ATP-binding protein [bacterium]
METQNKTLIQFSDVTLGYGSHAVLSDISFELFENDFVGLVGPNGSGKTTLLRAILGHLKPQKGRIERRNNDTEIRFGYVPQREHLENIFPFTAFEVVLMGTYNRVGLFKRPGKSEHDLAKQCLEHVGILDLKDKLFNNLSGGQKQRTLIARALATQPNILVLDEPTNGMDLISQKSILDLITQLHTKDKLTILMVSHLLTEVSNYVRKIILVEADHFQVGSLEDILTTANLSKMYDMPVFVDRIKGNNVVIVGEKNG